jgi:ABC-type multidrug transport system fused ATPase/permease subunit
VSRTSATAVDGPTPVGLVDGTRLLIGLMPTGIRHRVRIAVILGFLLAGIEFVAIFLLYPVFGFLTQGDQSSLTLPFVGTAIDRSSARALAVTALGLLIVRSLLTLAYRNWWLRTTARAELQLSNHLLRTYAYAPYDFHLGTVSTDLMARAVANVGMACQSGLVGLVGMASSALLALGLAVALIIANPVAGVTVTAYAALLAGVYAMASRRRIRRLADSLEQQVRRVYGRVHTLLRGIREITVFGQREHYLDRIDRARHDMVATNARVMLLHDIPRTILEVTLYGTILVALAALLSLDDPDQALPLVALYVVAGLRIMPSLAQILGYLASARAGIRVAERLADEVHAIEALSPAVISCAPVPATNATLRLERVGYRYGPGTADVLSDIDVEIPFGSFLGVIGPSGAGKTTLTSIILGLLGPTSGEMRYGDHRIESNDPEWFSKVAVVPQDVFLTDDSLVENILAGSARDDERLVRVVHLAGLDLLVAELPDGFDTPMLEGGARLSAGQRQRVGLARALYRRPEVLVLDEPTSALDAETEAHIIRSIDGLKGTMTVVAVAHRVHTLANADKVIRLEGGRISEHTDEGQRW